jgi:RimJ/RimL family protein N-acetyltransferase
MLFNNIETDRLVLKNIAIDDRNFIFSQFSDDVVNRYLFDAEPVTDMHIIEISACIYIDNQRSTRLVENLGFVLSGSMYQSFRNKEYLHNIYSLYLTRLV